jgi:hypothetical protein
MARLLIAIRYLIRFPTGFAIHFRFGLIDSSSQTRCHWSNWAPKNLALNSSAMSNSVPICYRCLVRWNPIGFLTGSRFAN